MKPKRITKKQFNEIYNCLRKKAKQLAKAEKCNWSLFLCGCDVVCFYSQPYAKPKSYRDRELEKVSELIHFLPNSCECRKAAMNALVDITEWSICLAEVEGVNDNFEYYLTVHRPGRCPWKEIWK